MFLKINTNIEKNDDNKEYIQSKWWKHNLEIKLVKPIRNVPSLVVFIKSKTENKKKSETNFRCSSIFYSKRTFISVSKNLKKKTKTKTTPYLMKNWITLMRKTTTAPNQYKPAGRTLCFTPWSNNFLQFGLAFSNQTILMKMTAIFVFT